jgi:MFS family permease
MMALTRSLHHRPFAWLLGGQTLSRIGDHLYEVVLAWWVLQETGSAVAMGSVLVLSFAPSLIFGLLGGIAVDRYPRAQVMFISDVLRGALIAVVAAMAFADTLQLWHVYVATLLYGTIESFFQPAYMALVPDLVPAADLPSANSLSSMSLQLGRVIGPALAGLIIALGGTGLGFALNALSFFLSAIFLVPLLNIMPPRANDGEKIEERSAASQLFQELREGIGVILANPFLWISFLVFPFANIALSGPYGVALPFLVEEQLAGDVNMLGLLYAVFAIGNVLSGIWLGRRERIRRRGVYMYAGAFLAGLGLLIFGFPVPLVVLGAAALLAGAGVEVSGLVWTNTLQEVVPPEKLGRVASIDMIFSLSMLPVGFALAGWLTEALGPTPVFLLGGGLTALLALLALAHPAIRGLD